jgi:hypothetical protein
MYLEYQKKLSLGKNDCPTKVTSDKSSLFLDSSSDLRTYATFLNNTLYVKQIRYQF